MRSFLGRSLSSSRWWLAAGVAGILLAAGIALGVYFATQGGDGTSEAQEPDQATATAAAGQGDFVERLEQALEADRAKPRFRGEMGDFVIVDAAAVTGYPCPDGAQPATNIEQSEINFNLPGAVIDTATSASCQGIFTNINAFVPGEPHEAMVGRGYFLAPRMELSVNAPAERLKLITVGGKPALAELPIPDCTLCDSQVMVIERFPSEAAPGIFTWARTINDLDRAIALVEQIMGVQQ